MKVITKINIIRRHENCNWATNRHWTEGATGKCWSQWSLWGWSIWHRVRWTFTIVRNSYDGQKLPCPWWAGRIWDFIANGMVQFIHSISKLILYTITHGVSQQDGRHQNKMKMFHKLPNMSGYHSWWIRGKSHSLPQGHWGTRSQWISRLRSMTGNWHSFAYGFGGVTF